MFTCKIPTAHRSLKLSANVPFRMHFHTLVRWWQQKKRVLPPGVDLRAFLCKLCLQKYVILQDKLIIEGVHLRENMIYHVQARMIPSGDYFRGFWSDWSPSSQFQTPKGDATILCSFLRRIRSVVWPSIPNPKNTLVQGYKPKKGPPVSFNPEAFIDNNIHLIDRVEDTRAVPDILERLGGCEFRGHGSSERYPEAVPRSSNSSVGESQPMLQSKSRGDKEGLEGDKLSHSLGIPGTPGSSGRSKEAYVTMSSFYKTQ
uniref:Uncharacterized protein n=1 Tax=Scleropages formosus TaxID=113540 RepID=A0A8C9WEY7_SCLFO